MRFSLRRWRPRHLLAAWLGYWVGLAAIVIGPAAGAILRATSRASGGGGGGGGGSVSASMGDKGITLDVMHQGTTLWTGTASLVALALWLVGPPIALWIAWLVRRPEKPADPIVSGAPDPRALREPAAEPNVVPRTPERVERQR